MSWYSYFLIVIITKNENGMSYTKTKKLTYEKKNGTSPSILQLDATYDVSIMFF